MVKKKGGLGRGLGALGLGGATVNKPAKSQENKKEQLHAVKSNDGKSEVSAVTASPQEIEVSKIKVNPNQPRTEFDEEALNALQDSIKEYGVLQPVIVRKTAKGYELIAGERRLRASKLAGKQTIPAIIKESKLSSLVPNNLPDIPLARVPARNRSTPIKMKLTAVIIILIFLLYPET